MGQGMNRRRFLQRSAALDGLVILGEPPLPRLLIHVAGFSRALVMHGLFGRGTPRGLWDLVRGLLRFLLPALGRLTPSHDLIWRHICNTIHHLPDVPALPRAA